MTLVPIQLPPGLERNNTPYDTPGAWWDSNLVRWQSGSMMPVKGNTQLTTAALNTVVRKIHMWRDNNNARKLLIGTNSKLYTDSSYTDITPTGFTPFSSTLAASYGAGLYGKGVYGKTGTTPSTLTTTYSFWTFGNWGEDVILTATSDGRLFYYTSSTPTVAPTVITAAPTSNNAVLVTDERHVMAIGQGGGGGSSRRVAWSSREDYTDWNFSSTTNTAGFQDLPGRTPLLKGVKVREGVLIFSMTDAFLAQYVGTPYIYGFQNLGTTQMLHPDGVATFGGKAVWLTRNGFQIYSGGFIQPLDCPILNDIFAEMDPSYGPFRIHASHNGVFPEVWFFYPTTSNVEANRYVIWNYQENWWARGFMSRSAMAPAEVFTYPIMGASNGHVYQHETGYTDNGTSRVGQIYVESGALGLGDGDQTLHVQSMLPGTGHGYSNLSVNFYSQFTPEGAETTFGPYTMRSNGYMDTRVSGRETRIRFAASQDADWSIGKLRFDVLPGGQR
jgi:hypothetical protein